MKLTELIEKGVIDVEDDIHFRTHADVMRLFGKDSKSIQPSFLKHPHEKGVHIWFPIIYPLEMNGWENKWGVTEDRLFERKLDGNAEYLSKMFSTPDEHVRILFAKIAPFGEVFYKFKGIYRFDPELSRPAKKAAYMRFETSAEIYPI